MRAQRMAWPVLGMLVLTVWCINGCINFRGIGKDLGGGMMDGVSESLHADGGTLVLREAGRDVMAGINEQLPVTSRAVMKGVGDGLRQDVLTDGTTERIASSVDAVGDRVTRQAEQFVDRLLASMTARSEQLSRGVMRGVGTGLANDVLVEENEKKLAALLGNLSGAARDEFIGQKAREQLVAIVKDVLGQATVAVDDQRAKLQQDLSVAETRFRNALFGILAVVLVTGAVITFVVIQWRRQDRLVQLLTLQIDRVPDEKARGELKRRIQDLATSGGLEPVLRQQLGKQGLLSQQKAS